MAISESVPTIHDLRLVGFPNPALLSKPRHPQTAAALFVFDPLEKVGREKWAQLMW